MLPALNISNLANFSNLPKLLKTPNLSNLPVMHLVAIAALLGVLMMLFFYRDSGTTERREVDAEMVFVADRPAPASVTLPQRSEERRVGKECSCRWGACE